MVKTSFHMFFLVQGQVAFSLFVCLFISVSCDHCHGNLGGDSMKAITLTYAKSRSNLNHTFSKLI